MYFLFEVVFAYCMAWHSHWLHRLGILWLDCGGRIQNCFWAWAFEHVEFMALVFPVDLDLVISSSPGVTEPSRKALFAEDNAALLMLSH